MYLKELIWELSQRLEIVIDKLITKTTKELISFKITLLIESRNVHRPKSRAVYSSLINTIKWRERTPTCKFINAEMAGDIFLFKYLSVNSVKKTMKAITRTSYSLSMAFTFSVLPMRIEAPSNWINRTVSDQKADSSTDYHLETLKFLVCFLFVFFFDSIFLINRENTWLSRSFPPFQNSFPVPVYTPSL